MKFKGLASVALMLALSALACALALAPASSAQRAVVFEGERAGPYETREGRLRIFDEVWEQVRERYFDPTFGGVDWQAGRGGRRPVAGWARGRRARRGGVVRRAAPNARPPARPAHARLSAGRRDGLARAALRLRRRRRARVGRRARRRRRRARLAGRARGPSRGRRTLERRRRDGRRALRAQALRCGGGRLRPRPPSSKRTQLGRA